MDTRYHIYFAGELLEGHALADVRAKMAKLFNANEATLEKLFSGETQAIKRNCDRTTASKYKAAIEKAGARPIIKVADGAQSAPPNTRAAATPDATPAQPAKQTAKQTAAEKIAALAAAADVTETRQPAATSASEPAATSAASEESAIAQDDTFGLAEVGSDVLREDERSQVEAAHIDTSSLELDAPADRLAPQAPAAPAAPDTSHLNVGEVGETLPTLPKQETALTPNTDSISLAPEGGDLSDCAPPAADKPDLDLSALDLAPAGAQVLEEQYRKRETAVAPDTEHLTLDE